MREKYWAWSLAHSKCSINGSHVMFCLLLLLNFHSLGFLQPGDSGRECRCPPHLAVSKGSVVGLGNLGQQGSPGLKWKSHTLRRGRERERGLDQCFPNFAVCAHRWETCWNIDSDPVGQGFSLRFCVSNKLPGDVSAAGPQPMRGVAKIQGFDVKCQANFKSREKKDWKLEYKTQVWSRRGSDVLWVVFSTARLELCCPAWWPPTPCGYWHFILLGMCRACKTHTGFWRLSTKKTL